MNERVMYKKEHSDGKRELCFLDFTQIGFYFSKASS